MQSGSSADLDEVASARAVRERLPTSCIVADAENDKVDRKAGVLDKSNNERSAKSGGRK